jgi:hypothetical protein
MAANPALEIAMSDSSAAVRLEAVTAWGSIRHQDSAAPVAALVNDSDVSVQRAAISVVGKYSQASARTALESVLGLTRSRYGKLPVNGDGQAVGLCRDVKLATLLRGLKMYTRNLTAVVTVADDGGSSGRLRESFGILPPGDIRNCLAALSNDERMLTQLFQYRFSSSGELEGHSFGNLFITALAILPGVLKARSRSRARCYR